MSAASRHGRNRARRLAERAFRTWIADLLQLPPHMAKAMAKWGDAQAAEIASAEDERILAELLPIGK